MTTNVAITWLWMSGYTYVYIYICLRMSQLYHYERRRWLRMSQLCDYQSRSWLRMSQLYDWKYLRRRPMRGRNFRVSRFSQITWWFRMSGNVQILLNFLDVPRASWPCCHRALHVGSQCGVSRHPRITKRSIKSLPTIQNNWSQIAPWGLLGELWGFSWCQTSTRPT